MLLTSHLSIQVSMILQERNSLLMVHKGTMALTSHLSIQVFSTITTTSPTLSKLFFQPFVSLTSTIICHYRQPSLSELISNPRLALFLPFIFTFSYSVSDHSSSLATQLNSAVHQKAAIIELNLRHFCTLIPVSIVFSFYHTSPFNSSIFSRIYLKTETR